MRDPLYRQIIDALNGDLDPDTFERCAQALLSEAYPTLVPMVGGNDAGFDGAVGTSEGPFPLLCTIDKSGPITNFRKNIDTYLAKRDGPKRAVVATPRSVSNAQKRNLEDAAQDDHGVTIVNIHDQTDFANRLYRNSHWCNELLGLSGRPPALSVYPPRSRPERPILVGRDEELAWLKAQSGDVLIVGQPGIGKTYLHELMALDDEAVFLVDDDNERIANALREQSPSIIVVDDAHESLEAIRLLRRLRCELGIDFAIHANCWPHGEAQVRTEMEISQDQVLKLEPLTPDQVLEIIKELGIVGPDSLLHILLEQVNGKPGLAAALVAALKRGEFDRVWNGEAIAEMLFVGRNLISNEIDRAVLAGFSMGGDAGMEAGDVANGLHLPILTVREVTKNLAAGGVIREIRGWNADGVHRLVVEPEILRGLLVRDIFYDQAAPASNQDLIAVAVAEKSSAAGLTHTLCFARQRGANISLDKLITLAERADSREVWGHLSFVDPSISNVIIERFPEHTLSAAAGILKHHPKLGLRKLVEGALAAESEYESNLFRQKVKSWVDGDEPNDPVSTIRRRLLLEVLVELGEEDEAPIAEICDWAFAAILAPQIDTSRTPPGSGKQVTLYFGLRSIEQLREIASLWDDVVKMLDDISHIPQSIRTVVEAWAFPQRHGRGKETPEMIEFMKETATSMATGVKSLKACGPACRTWLKQLARDGQLNVDVQVDSEFNRLFGERELHVDHDTRAKRRRAVLIGFADQLKELGADAAMAKVSALEREAAKFELAGGWDRYQFYSHLESIAEPKHEWLKAATESGIPQEYVGIFTRAAVLENHESLESLLLEMLNTDAFRRVAVEAVVSMDTPSDGLLDLAMERIESGRWVHISIPESSMLRLLTHERQEIRVYAALAEWQNEPEGSIRDSLQSPWKSAFLELASEDEYVQCKIFSEDTRLTVDWITKKLADAFQSESQRSALWEISRMLEQAVKFLGVEERWEVIESFQPDQIDFAELSMLIGDHVELAQRWITRFIESSRDLALSVLRRRIDETWVQIASIALNEGATSEEVIGQISVHDRGHDGGHFSRYCESLISLFQGLVTSEDERLRPIGEQGINIAKSNLERFEEAIKKF